MITLRIVDHHGGIEQEPIRGTLRGIYSELCSRLSVGGYRTITAAEDWSYGHPIGRQVTASLYDGESCILDARGRQLL